MIDTTTKTPGKIAQLHALWAEAGEGELLPRTFAVDLGIAHGFNPATCRTQYQVIFRRAQAQDELAAGDDKTE